MQKDNNLKDVLKQILKRQTSNIPKWVTRNMRSDMRATGLKPHYI